MNERLELIIKKFKKTLEKYPTCDECEVKKFRDKYKDHSDIPCDDVYKYLKEKGEI